MQKIKNKFIYFIILLIILIIWYSIYSSLFVKTIDRNSYVQLIKWEGLLNNNPLYINSREKLAIEDTIETTTEDSLIVIEWWDGSITRLWWNTSIQVEELFVSDNKEKLNIVFELFSWKTWSNVVSYIPEESYFKEIFMDSEAAVRWTIFNVDIEKDYIYVLDHSLNVTNKEWKTIKVDEKKPLKISDFSFLKLEKFIREIKDSSFDKLNRALDKDFIKNLKLNMQNKIQWFIDISKKELDWLSLEEKDKMYNEIMSYYQEINFISIEDWKELYDLKIWLKEKLLNISPELEKELLLNSFIYDLKDSIKNKNYDSLNKLFKILWENVDYINWDIKNYLKQINLDWDLEEMLLKNMKKLKDFISEKDKTDLMNKAKTKINNIQDKATDSIENSLNKFINN